MPSKYSIHVVVPGRQMVRVEDETEKSDDSHYKGFKSTLKNVNYLFKLLV